MAIENKLHVVLINPAGQLVHWEKSWGDNVGGSAGVEAAVKSGLQIIGVWVEKDAGGEQGGPFFDEYSTHSMLAVQETPEGITLVMHDITPASTRVRETLNDSSMRPQRYVDPKLAGPTVGKGANWDVFEDGAGTLYEQKLAEARALVGA